MPETTATIVLLLPYAQLFEDEDQQHHDDDDRKTTNAKVSAQASKLCADILGKGIRASVIDGELTITYESDKGKGSHTVITLPDFDGKGKKRTITRSTQG